MFFFLLMYLILVLIRPQDYPAVAESPGPPLQSIALVLAAGLWVFSQRKSFNQPQYLLIPIFLFIAMVSKVVNGWAGGALFVFFVFAPVLLAYVLLANAVDTRKRMQVAMGVFIVCASVLAVHGIDQASTGIGWTGVELSQGTRIQYVGIFNDPNDLGMLFVMCLPMAFYLSAQGGWLGLKRLFWWTTIVLLVWGCYLTNSRGTLLALVAMLGVYVWRTRGMFLASLMGAGALGGLMMLPSRMQEMDVSEASAMGRVESWYEGIQMFIGSPVFGIGAGGYSDLHELTAHNSFVLVLAETGIVGFTVWLAIVGYCFRMMLAIVNRGDDIIDDVPLDVPDDIALQEWKTDKALSLSLLLSLTGFFTAAFFLSRSYVIILYLLVALVVGHYTRMRSTYPSLPEFSLDKDIIRWPIIAVIGVIGLYLTVKVLLALA
ncbi:O-antigen ligase [Pseudoxanthomonas sp. 3HH-4]|uniref:O-antigen ligase family protein n=1 Tax=Pseudoxanthomonas sp. 3HH-4 TaxID=1690214 RepID=UPI00115274B6|nr:O-antigen ligase family protein [Pseudoxanthomonas sp. 3HH-4]TQM12851.1 O-antigen ligase [Pseudoxanthomonas sp. 3HH-4]